MKRFLKILVFVALLWAVPAAAGTIAIGTAGGNWSTGATWVGGVAPTAADDVVLTDLDGGDVLTVDCNTGSDTCLARSIDATGATGTLTHAAGKQLTVGDGTAGNIVLISGLTYVPSATSLIKFVSTTTGNQITTAGKAMGSLTFNGAGGGWTFQDAFNPVQGAVFTLTAGSVDTNNVNIGSGSTAFTYVLTGTTTRALTLGTSTITLRGVSGSPTTWDLTDGTNMTLSAGSSTIVTGVGSSSNATFAGGGKTYGTVQNTALTGGMTISGANTFGNLTLNGSTTDDAAYNFADNQTITGTLTLNGNSALNRILYRSSVRGTPRTLTAATISTQNSDFQDITGAGAGSWDLSAITGLSGDCGGNSGITFTTPATNYWVGNGGNWNAAAEWSTSSGGGSGSRVPLCQDTNIFDANSFSSGGLTVTQNAPRIGTTNWTGATNTPTWARSSSTSFFGNITLIAAMTLTGATTYTYEGRGASTFTSNGTEWLSAGLVVDSVDGVGSLTLGDAFSFDSTTRNIIMTSGTFSTANFGLANTAALTLNGGQFTTGSTGITIGGTFTAGAGSGTIGTGGIAGAGLTKNGAGTLTFNGASTFSGAIALSNSGTLNINENVTGSSTMTNTGQTVNITDATLAYNNGSFVGAGAGGGGGLSANPFGGFIH